MADNCFKLNTIFSNVNKTRAEFAFHMDTGYR
jgi:hypothetical protein